MGNIVEKIGQLSILPITIWVNMFLFWFIFYGQYCIFSEAGAAM